LAAKQKLEVYEQLAKVTSEKAELQSELRRESSEVERLQVRSPVDGIVKSFNVRVVGGVVAPGSVVAEVVPVGEQMMAFTRVAPKDIGNVAVGQKVQMKVQAYDYARFGTIPGRVESISAGTFQDEKTGEPYYKVRVQLDQLYAGKQKRQESFGSWHDLDSRYPHRPHQLAVVSPIADSPRLRRRPPPITT